MSVSRQQPQKCSSTENTKQKKDKISSGVSSKDQIEKNNTNQSSSGVSGYPLIKEITVYLKSVGPHRNNETPIVTVLSTSDTNTHSSHLNQNNNNNNNSTVAKELRPPPPAVTTIAPPSKTTTTTTTTTTTASKTNTTTKTTLTTSNEIQSQSNSQTSMTTSQHPSIQNNVERESLRLEKKKENKTREEEKETKNKLTGTRVQPPTSADKVQFALQIANAKSQSELDKLLERLSPRTRNRILELKSPLLASTILTLLSRSSSFKSNTSTSTASYQFLLQHKVQSSQQESTVSISGTTTSTSNTKSTSLSLTPPTSESVIPLSVDILQQETVTVEVSPKSKEFPTSQSVQSEVPTDSKTSSASFKSENKISATTPLKKDYTKTQQENAQTATSSSDSQISSETDVVTPSEDDISELSSKSLTMSTRTSKKRRSLSNDVEEAIRSSASSSSLTTTNQKTSKNKRDFQRKSATISIETQGVIGAAIASTKKSSHSKSTKEKKSLVKGRESGKNTQRSHIRNLKTRAAEMTLESLQLELEDTSESDDEESDEQQQHHKSRSQIEDKKSAGEDNEPPRSSNKKHKEKSSSLEPLNTKKSTSRQRSGNTNINEPEKLPSHSSSKPSSRASSLKKKRASARPDLSSFNRNISNTEGVPSSEKSADEKKPTIEDQQQQQQPQPQQQQPRLRKWFKHKEELSGPFKGPRTSLPANSVEEIEKALQNVLHNRRGDSNTSPTDTSRPRKSELNAEIQHSTMSSGKSEADNKKQLATDNLLIREIILTERDYVYDLIVITEIFLKPLRQQKIIPNEFIEKIFVNVEALLAANRKFLQSLETYLPNPTPAQVASCFLDSMKDFQIYEEFCSKQREAFDTIRQLKAENRSFDVFLEYCYLKRECRNLDINALLIKPVQRICKYPLLLQEMTKQLKGTLEGEVVAKAYQQMEKLVSTINEKKGAMDNLARVQEVENELSKFTKEPFKLVKEGRSLVSEGELFLINSISHKKSRGYYYLFSDLFLYTTTKILRPSNQRKFTIKYELPLDSVVIVEKEDFNIPNAFEIHHYANFFTKQTIIFCTKHATDKETLVSLLENRIEATLMETYKKFVLIHSGQGGANQISFEQWKNKKFPGSPTKEKKLSNIPTTETVDIVCEIDNVTKTIQTTRQNLNLLALKKLLENNFGSPGTTLLLLYKDSKTGDRVPIYTQETLNRAIAQSPSPKELHLILLNVES